MRKRSTINAPLDYYYTGIPQREVQWGTVYNGAGTTEGAVINPVELDRLANWFCCHDVFHHHATETDEVRKDMVEAGGCCSRCQDDSTFLLAECQFIEMNRSPILIRQMYGLWSDSTGLGPGLPNFETESIQ